MSFFHFDVYSDFFTPQEFPVEIVNVAKNNDVVACCLPPPAKNFVKFMLFKEFYYQYVNFNHRSSGVSVYIQEEATDDEEGGALKPVLTDVSQHRNEDRRKSKRHGFPFENLSSIPITHVKSAKDYKEKSIPLSSIVICSRQTFLALISNDSPHFNETFVENLNLVVISNVHEILTCFKVRIGLRKILHKIRSIKERRQLIFGKATLRTVFLSISLLHFYGKEANGFWRMEETFRKLETFCGAKVDTTSDIVALLRYASPPTERIILVGPNLHSEISIKLIQEVKKMVEHFKKFLNSHNFNPAASLGYTLNEFQELIKDKSGETGQEEGEADVDSLAEELKRIPHPKSAPLEVLREFEIILDSMGPWCANRAICILNNKVVGMKIQVPYVRHYLLLGALQTRLIWIQGIFNEAFDELDPLEVLENFSTPKLVSVLNILRRFDLTTSNESKILQPEENENDEESETELTVADYLEQQKQAEQQAAAARGGRFHGRRRHHKTRFDVPKQKKESDSIEQHAQLVMGSETPTLQKHGSFNQTNKDDAIGNVELSVQCQERETIGKTLSEIENGTKDIGQKSFPVPPSIIRQQRRNRFTNRNEDTLCGLLLCEDRFSARLLYHFLMEAADSDPKLIGLSPTIAIPSNPDYDQESREAEIEYKKREESLRKFRYREANLLIGTSLLEDGIELPKANLVIRFDESTSFRSYLFSKGRAQGVDPEYYIFTGETDRSKCLKQLSTYKIMEETLLSHAVIPQTLSSSWKNEMELEWSKKFPQFKSAGLMNSISIINRYCARLPSDTFTRLTPSWTISVKEGLNEQLLSCSLRLPINSPVKWPITGLPMPTERLAKKAVALQTVIVLHKNGELDDSLIPVGKEGVKQEPDLCIGEEVTEEEFGEFRPGSTRRRQYYDKQLSPELIHCLPSLGQPAFLYWLKMVLTCPLPEDQNTRGRKLHPPEVASQAFGILLAKEIPPVPPFPIYTRCGEVHVELVHITGDKSLECITTEKLSKLSSFHHYTFTSVLRLDKYLTLFDPNASENSYFVVPLKAIGKRWEDTPIHSVQMDWDFVDRIWIEKDMLRPTAISDHDRRSYKFNQAEYADAVVTPWYRNNDQPQFFYVAEICVNLTPRSQFPGCEFKTFEEYYNRKYNLFIHDSQQPLLDVDHTSARLNFLTPRYVNRKGMALPTSSETTKKAKRENLEQKQILIPELCAVHPFSASLWRQAVCLPCILYRVNSLLLANSIRTLVATQVHGLGVIQVAGDFRWDSLSFGWSLQDVFGVPMKTNVEETKDGKLTSRVKEPLLALESAATNEKKQNGDTPSLDAVPSTTKGPLFKEVTKLDTPAAAAETAKPKPVEKEKKVEENGLSGFEKAAKEDTPAAVSFAESLLLNGKKHSGKSVNEILSEEMKKCRQPELDIGTWSNEMATGGTYTEPDYDEDEDELLDPNVALPSNLMMLDKNWTWGGRSKLFNHRVHRALYGSPTHWGEVWDRSAFEPPEDLDNPKRGENDDDNTSVNSDLSGSDESYLDGDNNLKIQFEGNTAEAMDKRKFGHGFDHRPIDDWDTGEELWWTMDELGEHYKTEDNMNGEEEDELCCSFEKDEILREEFERRVEERTNEIQQIVNWNQITELPSRGQRKQSVPDEAENESDDSLLTDLLEKTEIIAPPLIEKDFSCEANVIGLQSEHQNAIVGKDSTIFSFDYNPLLREHCGPSPCQILQAITMSNANDGQNLERLETIGDSFLKYAITTYLFCTYESIHEGKLSHLRSKQVSNVHLYRLGRQRGLGGVMVSAKFEPHDNWLPPCYHIPKDLDKALIQSQVELGTGNFSMAQVNAFKGLSAAEIEHALKHNTLKMDTEFIPYNLVTQQSIPDKSLADCVEALIGAYLTSTGTYGALLFMSWLGIRVLPSKVIRKDELPKNGKSEQLFYMEIPPTENIILFDVLKSPKSPLLKYNSTCETQLKALLKGYDKFEQFIGYTFRDQSYLLQAFTHASYAPNTLTDCYQRLEFLGDAILDYLITRHLYEDKRQHSPGSLTDLRSALVNNTIFASLAVKNGFHMYFRHSSPGLTSVLQKFVAFQEQHAHTLTQDYYLMGEEECDEAEDIEVPKALGDVFESVAGAIFLDSGMSLDAVWGVYYKMMKSEIDQFSQNVPKSPIRELLELEPETAKFGKPEKLWDGRRVRVSVEIFGVGVFRGIGRNYRIAKCTAAKCALRHLKKLRLTRIRK